MQKNEAQDLSLSNSSLEIFSSIIEATKFNAVRIGRNQLNVSF